MNQSNPEYYPRTQGTVSTAATLSTNLNGTNSTYLVDYTFNANSNNMKTKQVKVAVFTVTRNDKSEVTSSKFVKELWVEVKNGASIDLVVAKELDKDFDPANTVIREITSIHF
jgi:hypothetical protein